MPLSWNEIKSRAAAFSKEWEHDTSEENEDGQATGTVGEIAIRKTLKKRMIIVPGTLAKTSSILIRLLPGRTIVALYDRAGSKKK